MGDVEVDQQADVLFAKSQIREQLSLVDGMDGLNALHLDDDQAFYEQVDSIAQIEFLSFVNHGQTELRVYMEAAFAEFVGQAGVVGALQQAGTPRIECTFIAELPLAAETWFTRRVGMMEGLAISSSLATCFGLACDGRGCLFVMNLKTF